LLERMARHVDQFFSPSRFTARMHAERGFSRPLAHLPHFIDRVDRDWSDPAPRPQVEPYFLFVGRLEQIKGLQTLIALWDRAPGCDLLVAGEGNYEGELRAMAAGNARIKFLGALSQLKLGALYHHALACIIPSVTYETFGMIGVEAFARKTPVIGRDLGAMPELIEDSGGGFIYRTDEELLDAMGRIAGSPQLRAELGQRGYDAFLKLWSREAHLRLYFDHLNRIAGEKFGRVPWLER
jgi:glycosyltransferase involved in cell wall biosynthesis